MVTVYHQEAKAAAKWFPMDKNYILKEVQLHLHRELMAWLSTYCISYYQKAHNPLGLVDDTILLVRSAHFDRFDLLDPLYHKLSSIFRYKYGEVQLAFLFDGASHFQKYSDDWKKTFKIWVAELISKKEVLWSLLEIIVFKKQEEHEVLLVNQRLQFHVEHHFDVRLYRYKGIIDLKQA